MDKIVITGAPPYDGEWEFDSNYFTNRELHTIKRVSGVRAGELQDALSAGDLDVIVALAVIALQRHGKYVNEDAIWDAEAGSISFEGGEEDEDPSTETTKSESASSASSDESRPSSGDGSGPASESQANGQSPTGAPDSSPFVQETSAT